MRAALNSERGRQVSDEVSRAGLLRTCRAWQRALRAARRGDGQGSMPPMAPLARRIRLGASITIPGIPTPTPRRRPATQAARDYVAVGRAGTARRPNHATSRPATRTAANLAQPRRHVAVPRMGLAGPRPGGPVD